MMSLWDALRMNMMISYQELVRTFHNTFRVKRGTVLFMCGIFSKEVLSKHVVVEYRFSAEP